MKLCNQLWTSYTLVAVAALLVANVRVWETTLHVL